MTKPALDQIFHGIVEGYLYSEITNDLGQTVQIPLSGIYVKLIEWDLLGTLTEVFGEAYTDDNGHFEIYYQKWQSGWEGDEIELFLKIKSRSDATYDIFSTNAAGSKYMHRVPSGQAVWHVGPDGVITNAGDIIMVQDDHTYYDAFRAVHWAQNGYRYFWSQGEQIGKRLRININYDNLGGNNSWYNFMGLVAPTIHLIDAHGDNENTTYHEFGHHAMYRLQGDNFTIPWGNNWFDHYLDMESTSVLAWVEGWAEFVQAVLDAHYWEKDHEYGYDGNDNFEIREDYSHPGSSDIVRGYRSEYYFACALYDLWDGPNKGLPNTMPQGYFHGWDDFNNNIVDYNWITHDNIELAFTDLCQPLVDHPSGNDKIYNLQDYYQYLIENQGSNNTRIADISRTFRENRIHWNAVKYNKDWSSSNFSSDEYYVIKQYSEDPNGPLNAYVDDYKVNNFNEYEQTQSYEMNGTSSGNNPITDNYWLGIYDNSTQTFSTTDFHFNSNNVQYPNATFTTYGKNRIFVRNGEMALGNGSGANTANIHFTDESLLLVDAHGKLTINSGSEIKIYPDNSFLAKAGATIEILGTGKLIFEEGSYACIEQGANIILQDPQSQIVYEGLVNIDISPNIDESISYSGCTEPDEIPFSGNGEILYDCEIYADFTYDGDALQVNSDILWSGVNYTFRNGIVINSGHTLTINQQSVLEFGSQAKIIVQPSATLILEDATLKNFTLCNLTWKGIEVRGNPDMHQYTVNGTCYQGKIIIRNNPIIENAVNAIVLGAVDSQGNFDDSKTGGIIEISNILEETADYSATFINNESSIVFRPYANYSPFSGGKHTKNLSYIMNCSFDVDASYLGGTWEDAHIELSLVDGVPISGCDFNNHNTTLDNPLGIGVSGYGSGFDVFAICSSQTEPCPEEYLNKCTFSNLDIGIRNRSADPYTTTVKNSVFNNNAYGIQLIIVNNAAILFNEFYAGYNEKEAGVCAADAAYSYGIDLNYCTGFAIEENQFTISNGAPPSGDYFGIRINETNAADEVYKNDFATLGYGNYAMGKNWESFIINKGLEYTCNTNVGNDYDFVVEKSQNTLSGIQSVQGGSLLPAGNTFSSGATMQFLNGGNFLIDYYYCTTCPGEEPDASLISKVNKIGVSAKNTCPSNHWGKNGTGGAEEGIVLTSAEKLAYEQDFTSAQTDYNNVKTLYDNLKDGGNTVALTTEVETAWPSDMWELRAELLGKSPHLSMDVLKKAADKTDVLPDNVIFEILSANPDELKKDELINYLEDKENPLPTYMVDILKQVATGTTYKTVLQQQMAIHNQKRLRAANKVIRSIVNDSLADFNALRNWLDNVGGIRADQQIIASYMAEGNFADALALADMVPGLYQLEGDELAEYNEYLGLLDFRINLMQTGKDIFGLDAPEIQYLADVADNGNGLAKTGAQNILEFAYGYEYCNCPDLSDLSGLKSSAINMGAYGQLYGASVSVQPNPATDWVAFDYTLPNKGSEAMIKITDASGKLIEVFGAKGAQGQKIWDTRHIKPGAYFYTFGSGTIVKSGKIIIVN